MPFHAAFLAVTAVPDWDQSALQPWVTFWPLAKEKPSDQEDRAVVPVLVTFTEAVNPVFQLDAVYFTEHAPVEVPVCVVAETADEAADTLPAASLARTVNEYAVAALRPVTV